MSEEARPRCAHDVFPYLHLMPAGPDLRTGKQIRLRTLVRCPQGALDNSSYCMAHSVLHGETHHNTDLFIMDSIILYRRGLLILPPTPDGMLWLPPWWPFRYN